MYTDTADGARLQHASHSTEPPLGHRGLGFPYLFVYFLTRSIYFFSGRFLSHFHWSTFFFIFIKVQDREIVQLLDPSSFQSNSSGTHTTDIHTHTRTYTHAYTRHNYTHPHAHTHTHTHTHSVQNTQTPPLGNRHGTLLMMLWTAVGNEKAVRC